MRRLHLALLGTALLLSTAGPSAAEMMNYTDGSLTLFISTLDPIQLPCDPEVITDPPCQLVSGMVNVTRSGGGAVTQFTFPQGVFGTSGLVIPVTDPAAAPILGIQATVSNGDGSFANLDAAASTGGGVMPILGVNKVCLFVPCDASPPANIDVPISVVGKGGVVTVAGSVNLTVEGAPWTLADITVMKIAVNAAAGTTMVTTETKTTGGISNTPNGTKINLVTPIFLSTQIQSSAVLPAYGVFSLTLAAPEPGALALGFAMVGGLLVTGWSKRRKS